MMSIYELEERILFDGALPLDIAEPEDSQELEETFELEDSEPDDISIAPEGEGTSSEDAEEGEGNVVDFTDPTNDLLSDSADPIEAALASLEDLELPEGFEPDPNILIVRGLEFEHYESGMVETNTILIECDSDDTLDSVLQQLKDELGDRKPVNIDITESVFEGVTNAESAAFLNELSELQTIDGELNVISDLSKDLSEMSDFQPPTSEIVFINSSIMDAEEIVDDLPETVEVVYLTQGEDGNEEITAYLSDKTDIDTIRIISHGNEGYFVLNGQVIDNDFLAENSEMIASWQNALSEDADIMLYGCNLAATTEGQDLVHSLAEITDADVAAATFATGNTNWALDFQTGNIESLPLTVDNYDYELASYTVTNLTDADTGSLRWAINQANTVTPSNPDEIVFDAGLTGTIYLITGELTITDDLTITGPTATAITVDGNNTSRIFKITSDITVTIQDITIQNGNATGSGYEQYGGGIYSEGDLTISNSTISGNTADQNGGGIYNRGNLSLVNSTISGNSAAYFGGGIYNYGYASATTTLDASLTITNSTINNNSADDDGGGIYNTARALSSSSTVVPARSYLTITDSIISENLTGVDGGGISNEAYVFGADSATAVAYVTITNSTISGNSAGNDGGGINNYTYDTSVSIAKVDVTITDSTINGNSAVRDGGGIKNREGYILLGNSTISGNTAEGDGGGIKNREGVITLTNSTISGNSAEGNGGGIDNSFGPLRLTNSTISGNSAKQFGGGIYNHDYGFLGIINSTISGNFAENKGGGVYSSSISELNATNSIIAYNYKGVTTFVNDDIVNYGPVYGNYNISPHDNVFWNTSLNTNTQYFYQGGPTVEPNNDLFYNYAQDSNQVWAPELNGNGGPTKTVALSENSIADGAGTLVGKHETPGTSGYAFSNDGTNWYLIENGNPVNTATNPITQIFDKDQRGVFRRNPEAEVGAYSLGPLYQTKQDGPWNDLNTWDFSLNDGSTWISATVVPNANNSRGITVRDNHNVIVDSNVTIDETTVEALGTITVDPGNTLTIADGDGTDFTVTGSLTNNGTIICNTASELLYDGGDQYVANVNSYYYLTLSGSGTKTFPLGTTTAYGGVTVEASIAIAGSTDSPVDTIVQAREDSDPLAANRVFTINSGYTVTINDITIQNGNATGSGPEKYGGGIYAYSSILSVHNSIISNNIAEESGGGIFIDQSSLAVGNSTISGNFATAGGGICNDNSTLTLTNSTVNENSAEEDGGGIYNYSSTLALVNSTISDNSAEWDGGGIYNSSSSYTTILNSTISGNLAGYYGGGIFNSSSCNLTATSSIIAYNYLSEYLDYEDIDNDGTAYGNYNISGYSGSWGAETINPPPYIYVNGKGPTLFVDADYIEIDPNNIYRPALKDNGGPTQTVALDVATEIGRVGVRTGSYDDSGTTKYAFWNSGWVKVEDGITPVYGVIEVSTDQRGEPRNSDYPVVGAYYLSPLYFRTNITDISGEGLWSDPSNWQFSLDGSPEPGSWAPASFVPNAKNSARITILDGHSIKVDTNISIDQTIVEPAGEIIVNSDKALTIVDGPDVDIALDGTLVLNDNTEVIVSGASTGSGTVLSISTLKNSVTTYDYTNDQAVFAGTYDTLILSGEGIKTFSGTTTAYGGVTVASSLTVTGDTSNPVDTIVQARKGSDPTATSRVFTIDDFNDVTIQNMTIQNGNATGTGSEQYGGGIYSNNSSLGVYKCIIQNNEAQSYGGGIFYLANPGSTFTVSASTISNNTAALTGGGIWLNSSDSLSATINDNTKIIGNTTSVTGDDYLGGGGLYLYDGALTIENSQIGGELAGEGNTSSVHGGGIYNLFGNLTLNSCTVSGNEATKDGGGIYNANVLIVNNSTISGNFANGEYGYGGGIENYSGTLTMTNTTVSGNFATYGGGGIDNSYGTLTIYGSTISGNTANSNGGGIYSANTISLADSTINGNAAVLGGGIFYLANPGSMFAMSGSTISNNTAAFAGGGIWLNSSDASSAIINNNTKIIGNTTSVTEDDYLLGGGGIYLYDGALTVENTEIGGEIAGEGNTSSVHGGGIYNLFGNLTLNSCTVSGNEATKDGGGIYNAGTLTVNNSTINGNTANGYYGGGIENYSGTLTMTNSTISGNSAQYGGGVSHSYDTLTVNNSTISGNTASHSGGGIFNWNGDITIEASTLSGNSASGDGGGIHNSGTIDTNYSTTISENSANNGGGIYNIGKFFMRNSIVSNNISQSNGGGICNFDYGNITINNSTISGNSADDDGGGICNFDYGNITINYSTVRENSADNGGGIGNEYYATLILNNSTISGNSASFYAGGIENFRYSTLILNNSTISGNMAGFTGGIGSEYYTTLILNNSTISGNLGYYGCGGIYNSQNGIVTATNSIIAYNYEDAASDPDDPHYVCNDIMLNGAGAVNGNYNISGFTEWTRDTGNHHYTYDPLTGQGTEPLFGNYDQLETYPIWIPRLADNGGATWTVNLDNDSIADDVNKAVLTATYLDGGTTKYAFYNPDPSINDWVMVEDGITPVTVNNSDIIHTDQRDSYRNPYVVGAYAFDPYYLAVNSGEWSKLTNWTAYRPISGWFSPDSTPNATNSREIIVPHSRVMTVDGDLRIDQTVINPSGEVIISVGSTLTIADGPGIDLLVEGSLINNGSLIAEPGATIVYAGGDSQEIPGGEYDNIVISGDLTSLGGNITVTGNWVNTGTFTDNNNTVTFSGDEDQTITGDNTFYNLVIDTTGGATVSAEGSNLVVTNDLTILNGVFISASDYHDVFVDTPGTLELTGDITVSGDWTKDGTFMANGFTVTFDGNEAQTIAGTTTFYDLTIANTGEAKVSAAGSNLAVTNDLLVFDGIFESASDYHDVEISFGATMELTGDITVSGDWENYGTFTPNGYTVIFDGTTLQQITAGSSSFHGMDIDNNLSLLDPLTATGSVDLAFGLTITTSSDVTFAGPTTGSGTVSASGGTVAYSFAGGQVVYSGNYNVMILAGGGTKTFSDTTTAYGGVNVNSSLVIAGSTGHPADTILQAHEDGTVATNRVLTIGPDLVVRVQDMTIRHGYSSDGGGGIHNPSGSTLTIDNCEIVENRALNYGGAVYNAGMLTINRSTISENEVESTQRYTGGGGIYNSGALAVVNSTISNNTVRITSTRRPDSKHTGGGGIYNTDTLTLINSTITGNVIEDVHCFKAAGAGIHNLHSSTFYSTNSIIAYNYISRNSHYKYDDINDDGADTYGNYNISSHKKWGGGTGNQVYKYVKGHGDTLFAEYETIANNKIYTPVLEYNDGYTKNVALAVEASIAAGSGVRTGYYDDAGTTRYAFNEHHEDGVWKQVENGHSVDEGVSVTEIDTDQRGMPRDSSEPTSGAYFPNLTLSELENDDLINFEGIEANNNKHPVFKTKLDKLLDSF